MVRRVTRERAHIFVATSVACEVQLLLYAGRVPHDGPSTPIAEGARVALDRIGQRLWVSVVPVDIPTAVRPGDTIGYDVILHEGPNASGLFALGLLGGEKAQVGSQHDPRRAEVPLGYENGMLPSFVIPATDAAALRIAHASCRKPHGGGEKEADGIQLLDAALKQAILGDSPAADRPQQLILTGDQIYADDVAAGLLAALTEAGEALLGWDEAIPTVEPLTSALLEPGWRTRFLSMSGIDLKEIPEDDVVDYSASHLLRFGEWCAMYLFAWSDALWRIDSHDKYDLPPSQSLVPIERIQSLLDIADTIGLVVMPARAARALEVAVWLDRFAARTKARWEETRTQALGYADSLRAVRRALANVATYTMFDDHEITDDWHLNRSVHDRLKGTTSTGPRSEIGPRLLRNGLSAYAIFQHWGNVPDDFVPGRLGRQLLDKWRYTSSSDPGQLATPSQVRSADTLLGITAGDSPIPDSGRREDFERFRWDYAVEFPGHRLVALDTRTWRYFPTSTRFTWESLAPLVPNSPGTAQGSGAAELHQIAAAWRQAAQASGEVIMESFAGLIVSVTSVAESVSHSRTQLTDRVVDVMANAMQFLSRLPGRAALPGSDRLDPLTEYLGSPAAVRPLLDDLPSNQAVLSFAIQALHELAEHDFGNGAQQLSSVVEALADFLETAALRSSIGMVHAARRATNHAGEGLWRLFTTLPTSNQANLDVLAAVQIALGALDVLTQAIGIDRLAAAVFRDGSKRLGVGLIRDDALTFQVAEPLATVGAGLPLTLVLSPAPIFGNELVELLQRVKVVQLVAAGKAGEEEFDFEAWSVNVPSMLSLFEAARSLTCAVVLSGDVHYGGSSVNNVQTTHATTRYIQFTSSAARNSDSKTRALGKADDLLYDESGTAIFFQSDWVGVLDHGAPTVAHLRRLARAELDSALESVADAVNAGRQLENLRHWWNESTITGEDVRRTIERVVTAPANSVRAWTNEAGWQLYRSIEMLQEFSDDPLAAVFGDFLTAGPALREQLHHLYGEIGLDPAVGLRVKSTVLLDRRPNRLAQYPAAAERYAAGSAAFKLANDRQRRTVGHANVGLISFATRGSDIVGVHHELRWFPHDEPARLTNPLPRLDWIGTLHVAGWADRPADLTRVKL